MKHHKLAVLFLLCLPLFGEDVSMFRGDAQHSGEYQAAGVPQLHGVKWKFRTRGQVIASPTIVGNTLYVGSTDHLLYALDRDAGTVKWKFKTEGRVASSAAVVNGVAYFGSYDGNFYAVSTVDGKLKWKFQTGGEHRFAAKHLHGSLPVAETMPDPFDVYLSSPVVADGSVYFGSGDGNIYALDATTGTQRWKFATGNVVHASPAVADGTVFIGSWDSNFYALDAGSGKEKWRFKTGEDHEIHNQEGLQASPIVSDGVVYVGCRDSNFYALDAKTGQKKWAFNNKGSWVVGSAAAQNGKIYAGTSDSGLLYVFDAKSGTSTQLMSSKKWPMFASPAIAGNMLYIGSNEGKLFALDLASQKQAWVFPTEGSQKNGATYTKPDGTPNYEAAFAGDFYDDMVAGMHSMLSVGAIMSSPVVVDNVVYFGSTDGNVYAVN